MNLCGRKDEGDDDYHKSNTVIEDKDGALEKMEPKTLNEKQIARA